MLLTLFEIPTTPTDIESPSSPLTRICSTCSSSSSITVPDSTSSSSTHQNTTHEHYNDSLSLVFSNTYLRAEIFQLLDRQSLSRALATSKSFFVGAVEVLYRDFKHQHYNKLVKRCQDQNRLQFYRGAVRTVDLSEETRTIQISKWENLISPFPNAKQIQRYSDVLYRETPLDGSPERYTFEYIYSERLFRGPRQLPTGRSRIPEHWKQRKRINLNVYEEQFKYADAGADESEQGECLKRTIIERMKQLDGPIDSLLINFRVSNHYVFDALRAIYEMGYGTPSSLRLRSIDGALFDILELTAKTLLTIYIPIRQYDATELGIDDFLLRTPWQKLTQVKHFDIPVRRSKHPFDLEIDPSKSFYPPSYIPPVLENENENANENLTLCPLSSNIHPHFIYPPDPEIAEKQARLDIESIGSLARALAPILGKKYVVSHPADPGPGSGTHPHPRPISATFPQFTSADLGTRLAEELALGVWVGLEHHVIWG
ncbi:hypothetical protein IAT40_000231 [Kwoniella sp. CBS 6097]